MNQTHAHTDASDDVSTAEDMPAIAVPVAESTKAYVTPTETKLEYKPVPTPTTFQVALTLDADTHEYYRALAAADDRSLNKFLARELKAAVASARTRQ